MGPLESQRVVIEGLPVVRMCEAQVVDKIFGDLSAGRGGWIVTANLDFMQRASEDPGARDLYSGADLIVADGAPLLWAARLMGCPLPERVAGSDLVWVLAERAALENRSLYLLGGDGEDASAAAEELRRRFPRLKIAGVSSPWLSLPPTAAELAAVCEEVVAAQPDLVYAGFGSPKQELVIEALRSDLPSAWLMGCGISLGFVAGTVPRAPRWMQKSGVEWVHRMWTEPRRLGPRYMRNIPYAIRLLWNARSRES
ncbi:MAG: WecB/TagA/CpsF family glycosyltransferase [bacterium]|nr:WecB/TagA/CpsF family glycosyltransferase [bacterium]